MNDSLKKVVAFPWYVLLISIYPAFYYWAHNASQLSYTHALRFVVFSFLLGLLIWGISLLIFRDFSKASITAFFVLIWFWTFGHVQNLLNGIAPEFSQSMVLLPVWIGVLIAGILVIAKRASSQTLVSYSLNAVTAFLILFQFIAIVPSIQQGNKNPENRSDRGIVALPSVFKEAAIVSRPDIYYIILDSYTRADVLSRDLNYDNSKFLSQLEALGFFVADCSQTNYSHTHLSLSSSLNYRYLDELFPIDPDDRKYPVLIKNSAVQRALEGWGYQTVAFETGHLMSELTDADVYFSRPRGILDVSEFDIGFLRTSLLNPILRYPYYRADLLEAAQYRTRVLFVLAKLAETPKIEGPKFVFAHVLIPHPPFVFGPNGEHVFQEFLSDDGQKDMDLYKKGYLDQTIYINQRVLEIVKKILSESSSPPIMIIQGDHGPFIDSKEAVTSILNAYYLPGLSEELPESISPVNTFRILFNSYFGQNFPILEDVARWSNTTRPLKFQVIPNNCQPKPASQEQ